MKNVPGTQDRSARARLSRVARVHARVHASSSAARSSFRRVAG